MLDKMTNRLDFLGNALILRAERQRVIASNIANADTPGFVARDFKFSEALSEATSSTSAPGVTKLATAGSASTQGATDPRHMPVSTVSTAGDARARLAYAVQSQPALDNNTVDLDRERANFVDNSVRYEAALRFINGNAKTMLSAIQGQ
ncbi:MAG: flagellar basal body rod protein FlgB [Acidovorax sp.]|jgi:flagellar basal-body rod protein FlgB|uniref:flagellar basal body rod protein FlgB n=1 Tax=Acidovorax sp. TaxID=1872122 RepID=UPI000A449274|nr:flagellar basal body rod protein FlgB [Acidovorax sp.]MCO4093985.1 flagellar basal body rod protein FlgB [Acidovorax sp.]MDH4427464.1 flagellar basal body rod protein FlgB [Acidovorax sp.]MDH4446959.1 flagellar basal body rod protein FlgB [Acidovorax sp.]MDH4462593.1 flagellar basal body rod protein FlgB [Acidovorax sp.]